MQENIPHYTYFVFPGPSVKKEITLEAFGRPTIPWSMECEKAGKTRQEMLAFSQRGLTAVAPDRQSVLWWVIWITVVFLPTGELNAWAVVIWMTIGMFISAIIAIQPFVTYVQYY